VKPIEASTCVGAWLAGCDYLLQHREDDWRAYNVILEIAEPLALPANERAVVAVLDRFLVDHGGLPFNTVVNTIFPAQLYQRHGAAGVYDRYLSEVYPKIKDHPDCSWGTYAQRILCRTDAAGTTIHPLRDLIKKLKVQLGMKGANRAVYELGIIDPFFDIPLYDPGADRTRPLGGPCLSHLTFKLGPDRRLYLTALYRSHWYVQRALGNLFRLAHLQHFVAQETDLELGPLVCISSVAQLEVQPKKWGKDAVKELISNCHGVRRPMAA